MDYKEQLAVVFACCFFFSWTVEMSVSNDIINIITV